MHRGNVTYAKIWLCSFISSGIHGHKSRFAPAEWIYQYKILIKHKSNNILAISTLVRFCLKAREGIHEAWLIFYAYVNLQGWFKMYQVKFKSKKDVEPVMHAGIFGPPTVWRRQMFEGRDKISLLGEGLKFQGILQKIALKLLKLWKNVEKISEKNTKFSAHFHFCAPWGKRELLYTWAIWGFRGLGPQSKEKFSIIYSKNSIAQLRILRNFRKFD